MPAVPPNIKLIKNLSFLLSVFLFQKKDGKEEIFKAGKKDTAKNRYYVSGNREPAVFLVQASNVEKLQKKKSDFKIEKAAGDKKPAENKDITPEIRPSQK